MWQEKIVCIADIKRWWGKYYSKSCKAKAQYKQIGYHKSKYELPDESWDYEAEYNDDTRPFSSEGLGQD
jgi:hypothetical protein